MKFTAVGDALIQRRIQSDFAGYQELAPFICRGDARFFNLETTLNREGECCASQQSGGTYMRVDPEVLDDLKKFGFNMTSFNNNHTLDFSYGGVEKTLSALDASGLVHGGVGRNLAQASAPRFLESSGGRAALISVTTSFKPGMLAGDQTDRIPGRPGVNGVRTSKKIVLPEQDMELIREIGRKTGINSWREIDRKDGYLTDLPENEAELDTLQFVLGDQPGYRFAMNQSDLARIEKQIESAAFQADDVIVSVHAHQMMGTDHEAPPEFLQEFAHRCIDAGADAVIGHGPHRLRPIEIYRDCPIFYSLGDFIIQLYDVPVAPAEFYDRYHMDSRASVYRLLEKRSKGFQIGLMTKRVMFETVIPYWEMKDRKLVSLELLPVMAAMEGTHSEIGLPRRASDLTFMEHLAEMSAPFGTILKRTESGVYELKREG